MLSVQYEDKGHAHGHSRMNCARSRGLDALNRNEFAPRPARRDKRHAGSRFNTAHAATNCPALGTSLVSNSLAKVPEAVRAPPRHPCAGRMRHS
jgi:hypothetical protein